MAIYNYFIKGNPEDWGKPNINFPEKTNYYHVIKHAKLLATISFESLHNDRPIINKPIIVEATFVFNPPINRKKRFCTDYPPITNMLQFVYDCAERAGVIKSKNLIIEEKAIKVYGELTGVDLRMKSYE